MKTTQEKNTIQEINVYRTDEFGIKRVYSARVEKFLEKNNQEEKVLFAKFLEISMAHLKYKLQEKYLDGTQKYMYDYTTHLETKEISNMDLKKGIDSLLENPDFERSEFGYTLPIYDGKKWTLPKEECLKLPFWRTAYKPPIQLCEALQNLQNGKDHGGKEIKSAGQTDLCEVELFILGKDKQLTFATLQSFDDMVGLPDDEDLALLQMPACYDKKFTLSFEDYNKIGKPEHIWIKIT